MYAVGVGGSDMTLTNPIQTEIIADSSFVAAINPNTPAMLFSSYFGGADINDTPSGIGVDSSGNIYVAGTDVADFGQPPLTIFPVFNAMQPVVNTPGCGFHIAFQLSSAYLLKIAPTDAPAAALSPGGLSFPVQGVGTNSAAQTLTIYDMGSAPLIVSNITVTGDFTMQMNTPCLTTIAPAGGSCAINISFAPTITGTETGVLIITDNSAGSPHSVQLVAIGGQGAATLSPTTLSFSSQQLGTTSDPQTVTLTNSGALALQISHIQASGPFNETNSCGTSLSPSSLCMISVTFAPTVSGAATGTLTFADSAPDSPQTVALTGNTATQGPSPSIGLGLASGSSASAAVTAGATATYALSIGGSGMAGAAALTCSGAPTGATCSIPATVPLSATAASALNVSVSTTARSQVWLYPGGSTPWLWALALLGCLALSKAVSIQPSQRLRWHFAPFLALTLCACGGGGSTSPTPTPANPNGTPAGAYTIVVTAKSGATTQTQNLTLTVR